MSVDLALAADAFDTFMVALGIFSEDSEHTRLTPMRVAKMYSELLSGGPEFEATSFVSTTNGMVVVRNIPFASICAHHFLPFQGTAMVGYLPKERTIGLSKIPRIVNQVSARPQIQEELTSQIAGRLVEIVETNDVAVVTVARHMCMEIRGVKAHGAESAMSDMNGAFRTNPETRAEFLMLAGVGR